MNDRRLWLRPIWSENTWNPLLSAWNPWNKCPQFDLQTCSDPSNQCMDFVLGLKGSLMVVVIGRKSFRFGGSRPRIAALHLCGLHIFKATFSQSWGVIGRGDDARLFPSVGWRRFIVKRRVWSREVEPPPGWVNCYPFPLFCFLSFLSLISFSLVGHSLSLSSPLFLHFSPLFLLYFLSPPPISLSFNLGHTCGSIRFYSKNLEFSWN